jgi:hypothetical protein
MRFIWKVSPGGPGLPGAPPRRRPPAAGTPRAPCTHLHARARAHALHVPCRPSPRRKRSAAPGHGGACTRCVRFARTALCTRTSHRQAARPYAPSSHQPRGGGGRFLGGTWEPSSWSRAPWPLSARPQPSPLPRPTSQTTQGVAPASHAAAPAASTRCGNPQWWKMGGDAWSSVPACGVLSVCPPQPHPSMRSALSPQHHRQSCRRGSSAFTPPAATTPPPPPP